MLRMATWAADLLLRVLASRRARMRCVERVSGSSVGVLPNRNRESVFSNVVRSGFGRSELTDFYRWYGRFKVAEFISVRPTEH